MFASGIRRKRGERMRSLHHWRWHPDEVFVTINGVTHYLWRAVEHEGEVLEALVTKRRDRKAALKFLRKALKRHGRPHIFVTGKLRSCGAALKDPGLHDNRETGRWLNNRAENSHQPFRRRERAMLRFRRMRTLQKFAAVHSSIHNHFNQERALHSRDNFKANRAAALTEWRGLCAACGPTGLGKQRLVRISLTPPTGDIRAGENISDTDLLREGMNIAGTKDRLPRPNHLPRDGGPCTFVQNSWRPANSGTWPVGAQEGCDGARDMFVHLRGFNV